MALNPPYLFFLFFCLFCLFFLGGGSFLSLRFIEKKTDFPPQKRAFLFVFECLPPFLLGFFWPPIFLMFFLSYFFCLFVFLCVLFWFLVFVFHFFLFCFWFHERTTSKDSITKMFHQSFWGVSCLAFFCQVPFSYLCFPDFKLCSCSTTMFLVSKQTSLKHQFLVNRGVATKHF